MKHFAISMKTDWMFDEIEAWINEGKGRMAKIWGDSTVAHFARKVRRTILWAAFAAQPQTFFATYPWPSLRRSTVAHFACKVRGTKIGANL